MRILGALSIIWVQLLPSSARADNLGLTLQILQGSSSKSGIEDNTRLWFVVEPGTSKFRKVVVKSTSNIPEKITMSIGAVKRVNGESQLAIGESSETEKWSNFSEQNFILGPRNEKVVDVGFSIPVNEEVNSYAAMLLVKATSVLSAESKLAYSVPGAAQIAAPIFLGVGTEDEFLTKFEIKSVKGQNTLKGKSLRVEIKNSGKSPVSIQGDVQAVGITFRTGTVGPFYYQTETIAPGETKFADAFVGDSISEAKWKIYVTAVQGQITESREFEVNISYSDSNNLISIVIKILVPLFFMLLLYWSIHVLREKKKNHATPDIEFKSNAPVPSLTDEQIRQLIQEYERGSEWSRPSIASTAKKQIKKATPRKAVTKKATSKKAVVKKAVAKKPSKKIAKKSSVKKTSSVKKVKKNRS